MSPAPDCLASRLLSALLCPCVALPVPQAPTPSSRCPPTRLYCLYCLFCPPADALYLQFVAEVNQELTFAQFELRRAKCLVRPARLPHSSTAPHCRLRSQLHACLLLLRPPHLAKFALAAAGWPSCACCHPCAFCSPGTAHSTVQGDSERYPGCVHSLPQPP